MCARYSIVQLSLDDFAHLQSLLPPSWGPRYNAAPGQDLPVILGEGGALQARLLRWGLVPGWAKDPKIGHRLVNARSEGAAERPAFRRAWRERRCLVPADGFYEWRRQGRLRLPYRFVLTDGRPFHFAGLWEEWRPPGRPPLRTFTILTTEANALVGQLHDRMPVILTGDGAETWLDPGEQDPERLRALMRPHPAREMRAYPVSGAVNSVQNDGPGLIEPLAPEGEIPAPPNGGPRIPPYPSSG